MGGEKRFTKLEIFGTLYFIIELIVMACKFAVGFTSVEILDNIFRVFYCSIAPAILIFSFFMTLYYSFKSKSVRNDDELSCYSRNIIVTINMIIISFEMLAGLFSTLMSTNEINIQWLELTMYIIMIFIIINYIVYIYIRGKINAIRRGIEHSEIINRYMVYGIVSAMLLGIIIPNFLLHIGIITAIRGG